MADIYCRSVDGDNANDGSTRALAKKTAEDGGMSSVGDGALTAAGAGGRVFFAHDHAQTEASAIILVGGTINAPIRLLSTDFSTNGSGIPNLRVGASIATTGANLLRPNGYAYVYGVDLTGGNRIDFNTADCKWVFELGLLTSTTILIGSSIFETHIVFQGTNIDTAGFNFGLGARLLWNGGTLISNPSSRLFNSIAFGGHSSLRNVDLSICTVGLVRQGSTAGVFHYLFQRCIMNASYIALEAPITGAGILDVRLHLCDSANTTIAIHEESYEGVVIDETTIVRTGGMSDGTTPLSLKMTTNANAVEFVQPLVSPPISTRKIKTLGLKTLAVEIIHDNVTPLQNDEIWIEAEDSTGATVQGRITNNKLSSILGTPADQPASTKTWTMTGLTNPNTQVLAVDITLLKLGQITLRVYLAKPSTTAYIDWKIIVS